VNEICRCAIALAKKALDQNLLPGKRPERMLFVTLSGAHLYGFPSPDSDLDLRGTHVLPLPDVIGLRNPEETYETHGGYVDGIEIDCVSHDLRKYLELVTRKNGYVLEQILSPLVVYDGGLLEELRSLARGAITKRVVHHYCGFFQNQEKLLLKEERPKVKSVLYLFRVAMTGLHVLRTGEVNANLPELNGSDFHLSFIPDLIARKVSGAEKGALSLEERDSLLAEAKKLEAELEPAAERSHLPEEVPNWEALNAFLVRVRTGG
jgi:uncharacterized protein